MSVPGSNLLNQALRVIAKQTFTYYAYVSRATQPNGMVVTTYASPLTLTGSVQPVPRAMYQQLGLNWDKNYVTVYVSANVLDVARDTSGDQIIFNAVKYQCESRTPWFFIDGWNAILCVQVA